jgi:hypothetical protein
MVDLCESTRLRASPISSFGRLAIYQNQGFSIGPVAEIPDAVQAIHSRSKTLDITFGGVTCNTLKMVEESFGVVGVFFWL